MKFNKNDLVLAHCIDSEVYGYISEYSIVSGGYLIKVLEANYETFGVGCSFWFDENELEIPNDKTLNRLNKLITFK